MATPTVPTYRRPEHLARVVRLLNEYYRDMSDVEEWEAEVKALREEIRLLEGVCIPDGTMPGMVASYGRERVQGGGQGSLMSPTSYERSWIRREVRRLAERAHALDTAVVDKHREHQRVMAALAILTPLQRQVIEGRHRYGIKCMTLAQGLHYQVVSIGSVYCRALARLAQALR